MSKQDITNGDYPLNLLNAAWSLDKDEPCEWEDILPSDFVPSVEYAVATLRPRESEILHERYRDLLSVDIVAKSHSVTRERIRQLERKALSRLREPYRFAIMTKGVKQYTANAALTSRQRSVEYYMSERLETAIDGIEYIAAALKGESERQYIKRIARACTEVRANTGAPIEELGLSVRSYNCLKRIGKDTIHDVMDMTETELASVRNLGVQSRNEIKAALAERGLYLKEER